MKDVYGTIDFSILENNPLYSKFHGDLQFDNILYDGKKFFYIDWREEYGGNTDVGDVYYDLAKMMGGLIISYNKMKDETNIVYLESTSEVITYPNFENAHKDNLDRYIVWLEENNFDVNKVKLIVALIFLNMSPLHEEKFSKFLWFKSLTLLYDYYNK
jgi:thiamine kinase-like enzyme